MMSISTAEMCKFWKPTTKFTSIISRATKEASCITETRSGVTASTHEPTIDPTVRLYILESFKLSNVDSNCSIGISTLLKLAVTSFSRTILNFQKPVIWLRTENRINQTLVTEQLKEIKYLLKHVFYQVNKENHVSV